MSNAEGSLRHSILGHYLNFPGIPELLPELDLDKSLKNLGFLWKYPFFHKTANKLVALDFRVSFLSDEMASLIVDIEILWPEGLQLL